MPQKPLALCPGHLEVDGGSTLRSVGWLGAQGDAPGVVGSALG